MTYSAIPGDNNKCECSGPGCPVHKGISDCRAFASTILYRVDMEDNTGTATCPACADDAYESGLFTDSIEDEEADVEDCPQCGESCNGDVTIADHNCCIDCHKQNLLSETEEAE